ncbi:hypothetical protein [Streptomyces sp. NPDC051577]|uniref:hypothetical protein n=1 Tax=Streptomyces sp. NPDC051577 TaxID=3155166 RepID=UPI0034339F93
MDVEPTSGRIKPRARMVMRPGLDARTENLLRDSRYSSQGDSIAVAAQVLFYGTPPVALGALLQWLTDDTAAPETLQQVLAWWPAAAGVVMLVAVARAIAEARQGRAIQRVVALPDQWVQPHELAPAADELLGRAQEAIGRVRNSTVHRRDLIDRDRNEALFPVQEWEIATALRDYSRLVSKGPKRPQSVEVTELIVSRRNPLEVGMTSTLRRVKALETFAAQAGEADARYEEMRQNQEVTGDRDEVLDFLARTVRDDLAIAEIDGLTGEAGVVAAGFARALEKAKESAAFAFSHLTAS